MNFALKSALALVLTLVFVGEAAQAKPGRGGSYAKPELSNENSDDGLSRGETEEDDAFASDPTFSFDPATSKPIKFDRMTIGLRRGDKIGEFRAGWLCVPDRKLYWKGSRGDLEPDDFSAIFFDEVQAAGLRAAGDPDAMFRDESTGTAEIVVRGSLRKLDVQQCASNLTSSSATLRIKTNASTTIEWQVYSVLDRKVVYKTRTVGSIERKDRSDSEDYFGSILDAFSRAARNLLYDQGFQGVIANSGEMITATQSKPQVTTLQLDRGAAQIVKSPQDFANAVGTIFATDGMGSGFFITSEGHMLTNHHVVGGAKYVKIKMKSGEEYLAEVIRTQPHRDVALLKVSAKPAWIVEMNRIEPNVGEEVYAVGTPIDPQFSATLTKGIVSAKRVLNGQRYIQSDTAISGGNSGGPMFNKHGQVVAMSTSGSVEGENLNFFGTVNDLLNALAIEVH